MTHWRAGKSERCWPAEIFATELGDKSKTPLATFVSTASCAAKLAEFAPQ
jgi:hypothetical protein